MSRRSYNNMIERRHRDNLCLRCGSQIDIDKSKECSKCKEKRRLYVINKAKRRREDGLCRGCGKPVNNNVYCEECALDKERRRQERAAKRIKESRCFKCGGVAEVNEIGKQRMCEKCWMKYTSERITGTIKNWEILLNLLNNQNRKCPYTGEKLIIGLNAVIDHIIPKSRGGSNDVSNLQWIDATINQMKTYLTHTEFIAKIKSILEYVNSASK